MKEHRAAASLRTAGYQDIRRFFQPTKKKKAPIPIIVISDDEDMSIGDVSLTHEPMGTPGAIPLDFSDVSVPAIQDNSRTVKTTLNLEQSHWFHIITDDGGTHTVAPVEEEEKLSEEELIMEAHSPDAPLTGFSASALPNIPYPPQNSSIQPKVQFPLPYSSHLKAALHDLTKLTKDKGIN